MPCTGERNGERVAEAEKSVDILEECGYTEKLPSCVRCIGDSRIGRW